MSQKVNLFIDHSIVFEKGGVNYTIHADIFRLPKDSQNYPVQIFIHKEAPANPIPLHHHDGIEIIYSRNKKLTVTVDGKKTCLNPGEFVLISSGALHSVMPSSGSTQQDIMCVSFQSDYLQQMSPYLRNHEIGVTSKTPEKAKSRLAELCGQLREYAEKSPESEALRFETNQILFAMLQMIFHGFLMEEHDGCSRQSKMRCKMAEVLDYMQDHYRENLTTQSVADHFSYTREYFCRLFKRYANETFKSYLTEIRMIAVVQKLEDSDEGAVQIAIEHGFPDAKSFFVAFKKKYGMTPAHWRENREMEINYAQ